MISKIEDARLRQVREEYKCVAHVLQAKEGTSEESDGALALVRCGDTVSP